MFASRHIHVRHTVVGSTIIVLDDNYHYRTIEKYIGTDIA